MLQKWNLSELAVRHQALTLYFLIVSLIVGTLAFFELGRAEDPSFTIKVAVVSAKWPGATPEQMQNQVADLIERKLQQIPYFDRVETTARPGQVNMMVVFKDYTPPDKIQDLFYQIRKRMLDLYGQFPAGVQGPFVNDDFSDVYFTLYALTQGHLSYDDWVKTAENTRKALLKVDGVEKVRLLGEQQQRISIAFNNEKLARLGLTQAQILSVLKQYQTVEPSGFVETQGPRVYLRSSDNAKTVAQIRNLPIAVGGQVLHLADLAKVSKGFVTPSSFIIRNEGKQTLMLGVVMKSAVNGLALSQRLSDFSKQWQTQLPKGVNLVKVTNQGDAIALAVDTFQLKFFIAVFVVMVVSFLTLGWRAGLVVAFAIPVTLALTFFLMELTDKNLDRITLGSLILALGLLVDDAIISIEMMLVKMEEGLSRMKSAAYAWTVTASPMLFGTLITIMGFVPIGFAQSDVGEYTRNIFWILAFSLLLSWLVAVTFTPYLGYKLLPTPKRTRSHHALPHNMFSRYLSSIVIWCVGNRKKVVLITLGLFVLSVLGMKFQVEKQFFPTSDRPELLVDINLPEGSSEQITNQMALKVEDYIKRQPEVKTLSSYIGQGAPRFFMALNPELPDPAFAKIIVVTHNAHEREKLKKRLKAYVEAGHFSAARVRVHTLLYGPPVAWPVTFRVMGDHVDELRKLGEQVRKIMAENPHIRTPNLEWGNKTPMIALDYNQDRMARLGLTPMSLSQQLQSALQGVVQSDVFSGTRRIELTSFGVQQRADILSKLNNLTIETASGSKVPLEQVAKIKIGFEDPVLKRRNRVPSINVNAEVSGAQPPDVTMAIWKQLQPMIKTLPKGYHIEIGGSVEESARAQASIQKMMPVMVLLMITLIMLNMQSFLGTFMVLITAPLGLIGAVAAMLLFSQPFGFVANLGMIGLAGILMRNTLILVGQINENEKQGMSPKEALIDATLRRSRPVLLTALAAILAFIPLTTNTFWGPLAFVLIGGIGVGTLLTLLFIPALYALWYRVKA